MMREEPSCTPTTRRSLLYGLLLALFLTSACAQPVMLNCEPEDRVILVRGSFDSAGEELLTLEPVQYLSLRSGPLPCQQEGHFMVEVTLVTGEMTIVPFDALIADDTYPGETRHGFFEVIVPVSDEVSLVRIIAASGEKVFASIEGSAILP